MGKLPGSLQVPQVTQEHDESPVLMEAAVMLAVKWMCGVLCLPWQRRDQQCVGHLSVSVMAAALQPQKQVHVPLQVVCGPLVRGTLVVSVLVVPCWHVHLCCW